MTIADTQISKRKWQWLRFWIIAIGGSLALVAIFWLICFFIARHSLQAELDAIMARGEPVNPGDFKSEKIPENENAAVYWRKAFASASAASGNLHIVPPSASDLTYNGYPPFSRQWHEMADATVADEANALLMAHQASQYNQTSWGVPFQLANMNLNQSRFMANVIADAALQAHETGDDALAFDRMSDLLHEFRRKLGFSLKTEIQLRRKNGEKMGHLNQMFNAKC